MTSLPAIPAFALGRLPRITFGEGTFARVPELAAAHGSRALLVTGGRSLAASGRRRALLAGFDAAGISVVGDVAVLDEPSPDVVDRAVAAHRAEGVDVVVGVGGGSVLDAAKAIAGLLRTGTSVRDHLEGVGPGLPYPGPSVPFVAVPTTAGTGSEASRNAVISERGPNGYKRSFRDERLVAADAVVDPACSRADRAPSDRRERHGRGHPAARELRLVAGRTGDRCARARRARGGPRRAARLARGPGRTGRRPPPVRGWRSRACSPGSASRTPGSAPSTGSRRRSARSCRSRTGSRAGRCSPGVTVANVAALSNRDPDSPALPRYATLGRLLAGLPPDVPDAEARDALIATLAAWTTTLAVPRLGAYGLDDATIAAVVAGSRGSSMRTNPIVLDDAELGAVLRAAI